MSAGRPCDIYREQLIPLDHGHALWQPNPVEGFYDQVTIGDVGYLSDGFFHRMFNVLEPLVTGQSRCATSCARDWTLTRAVCARLAPSLSSHPLL